MYEYEYQSCLLAKHIFYLILTVLVQALAIIRAFLDIIAIIDRFSST